MQLQYDKLRPEVRAYLHRLKFSGVLDGSAATLATLQEQHLHTIPYENLDILRGVPISLEIDDLLNKIVYKQRGGYCFELCGLFAWLLQELGYEVTSFFARFWRNEPNPPPKRRHHVLKVRAEGEYYLCDVGVGGVVPVRPLKLIAGIEQPQGDECYRLEKNDYFGWMLYELNHGEWRCIYSFTEEPQLPIDFITTSYWCEHSPDSPFRKQAMIAIRTSHGRDTVAGEEFRIFSGDTVHTFIPKTEEEYHQALKEYFGIILD